MYLGVDIGGTKTLVACLSDDGVINEKYKFQTPQEYREFLEELKETLSKFSTKDFVMAGVAAPAVNIDRAHDQEITFGNLPWKNVNLKSDVQSLINSPVVVENDAKLAGLSEAMLVKDQYSKVLYVTVSTGIGYSIINNCQIDTSAGDGGGKVIMLERDNKLVPWESLASGNAIVKKFGKMAKDIDDAETWQQIASDLGEGLIELIEVFQPDIVVVGGGVGNYFDKFGQLLSQDLKRYDVPLLNIPPLKGAERADDAVIYGCYDFAKQVQSHE